MIGHFALTILLAIGAIGLGLFAIRSARFDLKTTYAATPFDFFLTALVAVIAIACGLGAVHFFNQIGG